MNKKVNGLSRRHFTTVSSTAMLGVLAPAPSVQGAAADASSATTSPPSKLDREKNRISVPNSTADPRVRRFVAPQRIVWQTEGENAPKNSQALLTPARGESSLAGKAASDYEARLGDPA